VANSLYNYARELAATSGLDWVSSTFHVYLVDTGAYTFSAAHQFLSSVAGGALIAGPVALTGKTATGGACDAADATWTAVTGATCEAVIIVRDTGSSATSPLIAYIDTATNLPVTPSGVDITAVWDNGANKIFRV
jgi:hypothetical protein